MFNAYVYVLGTGLLAVLVAFVHEHVHFLTAVGLGYRARILWKRFFYVCDIDDKILGNKAHTILAILSPQIITAVMLWIYLCGNILVLPLLVGHICASTYDYALAIGALLNKADKFKKIEAWLKK